MDGPVEPPPCVNALTTTASGLHYVWVPAKKAAVIGIFNPTNKEWTLQPTTGTPPPELWDGGSTSIGNEFYLFGGDDRSSYFNELHKLNLQTFQWSKVHPKNDKTNWPMPKTHFGFVAVDNRKLCCFGGYVAWDKPTNELHLYDVQEGTNLQLQTSFIQSEGI